MRPRFVETHRGHIPTLLGPVYLTSLSERKLLYK
jgi:hypothetical protein